MLFDAHPLSKAHARALLFSTSLIDLYKQKTSAAAAALQLNHVRTRFGNCAVVPSIDMD